MSNLIFWRKKKEKYHSFLSAEFVYSMLSIKGIPISLGFFLANNFVMTTMVTSKKNPNFYEECLFLIYFFNG